MRQDKVNTHFFEQLSIHYKIDWVNVFVFYDNIIVRFKHGDFLVKINFNFKKQEFTLTGHNSEEFLIFYNIKEQELYKVTQEIIYSKDISLSLKREYPFWLRFF